MTKLHRFRWSVHNALGYKCLEIWRHLVSETLVKYFFYLLSESERPTLCFMEKVNQAVSDALATHRSIRILGDLPTEKLNREDYLASTRELIESLVDFWKEKADLRLLAVEVWPRHTYFALDFNNDEYNYDNAHTHVVVIPVYLFRLSRKSHTWTIFRHKPQDSSLAKRIADLHEFNGQDPIPFLEDHIEGVTHYAPRNSKNPVVASENPT
ncbi:uncharacterized protein N7446_010686 [Penicillium canescens]|uniref:Uncharacterized protein n=1 Tax=Penicillium canescens TaxID=5083 RepID=A0AAD6IB83_PENCN|nr:uncharacterized protein N7446_010686 [Penicillium canescens]KAJ6041424.1 hypothetical protein N7460_006814 [Penicillium canescens]KAJ6050577.1 hypothetical protein N7446_010686 [Penicillium canescens]KAJ6065796.1 hypothetical protein N7444_001449 [Penicillium canescens]